MPGSACHVFSRQTRIELKKGGIGWDNELAMLVLAM